MIKRNYSFNCNSQLTENPQLAKHSFLLASGAISLGVLTGCSLNTESNSIRSTALTKERRDALTPGDLIRLAKQGNERFRKGEQQPRDFLVERQNSAQGQQPAAVLLTCTDSRAPAEIVLDLSIGDVFNSRVAENTNPNKFSYCSFSNGRRLG